MQVKTLEDKKAAVQKTVDMVTEVFTSGKFYEIQTQNFTEPVRLSMPVVLTKRSDSTSTTLTGRETDVGKPTVHVSGGIGFSTIDDITIVRQPGLAADGKTQETHFGYQNNSSFKPSAIVMLNVPWKEGARISFGPAVGLVVSGRGDTANVEYVGGGVYRPQE